MWQKVVGNDRNKFKGIMSFFLISKVDLQLNCYFSWDEIKNINVTFLAEFSVQTLWRSEYQKLLLLWLLLYCWLPWLNLSCFDGAMTIRITTFSIMTPSIIIINDATLNIMTLSIIEKHCYAECHLCWVSHKSS
jgi:hypothetical protein